MAEEEENMITFYGINMLCAQIDVETITGKNVMELILSYPFILIIEDRDMVGEVGINVSLKNRESLDILNLGELTSYDWLKQVIQTLNS